MSRRLMYLIDTCTSAASASSSTGCRPTSRATSTAWPTSTAPTSTSTPTRARAMHPDWGTLHLQLRPATRSATSCISNALFWLDKYHIDGLRVDAVASMLYLDYSRKEGRVDPQPVRRPREPRGHRLPAPAQRARSTATIPTCMTIAEESTAWPMVSRPTYAGRAGLRLQVGHGLDARHARVPRPRPGPPQVPPQRADLPHALRLHARTSSCRCRTTRSSTARARCWRRCRATTGRSSPTCGCSSATCTPSPARSCCSWAASSASGTSGTTTPASTGTCCDYPPHAGLQRWVRDLNTLYRGEPALHEHDCDPAGFEWIDCQRRRAEHDQPPAQGPAAGRRRCLVVVQLHAGAAAQLPGRRAAAAATGRRCSTATRRCTAAAARATSAACMPKRSRRSIVALRPTLIGTGS